MQCMNNAAGSLRATGGQAGVIDFSHMALARRGPAAVGARPRQEQVC
jgi:hypothetical protein